MRKLGRFTAAMLAAVLLCLMAPVAASATVLGAGYWGAKGSNLHWELDSNGNLTITGSGSMGAYNYTPWLDHIAEVRKVTIGSGVTDIGEMGFAYCENLTSITIPASVTSIGEWAFYGCKRLTGVTLPSGVTSIGHDAFNGCSSLTSVNIPSGVKVIEKDVFYGCAALKSASIPAGVTAIGEYAFTGCAALTSVTIPAKVTSIGYAAFYNCAGLTTAMIPASVKTIGDAAFLNCPKLTIYGESGTAAQTYAKANEIPFVDLTDLPAPKLSTVTYDATGVTVTWGKVTGAAKYRVFYKTAATGGWKKIADTTGTSYTWTGAADGTTYTFTVRCVSADGSAFTSSYDTKGVTVSYTKTLATPAISGVSGNPGNVTIKWGAVTGAAKYRVFYKGGDGWKKIADTTGTSYVWTAAEAGKTYTFTVRCVSSDGSTFTSNYNTAGTSYTVPSGLLATPKINGVSGYAGGVTIKWGAVAGAAKYRVFYKSSDGWKKIADTTGTSYTWAAAAAGTKYTFTVRCVSSDGAAFTSNFDTAGTVYTVPSGKLATPKLSTVTYDATGVTMKWGAVSGAAKYRVFYKANGSGWTKIADTTSTSYVWKGAKDGTTYTFTVRCVSADGTAFTSDYDATGKTIAYASTLATPRISSVSAFSGEVTIKWGPVPGAAKYRVFYKGSDGWKKIADTTDTTYVWHSVPVGTYTFTVRCVTADGATFTSAYDTAGVSITLK